MGPRPGPDGGLMGAGVAPGGAPVWFDFYAANMPHSIQHKYAHAEPPATVCHPCPWRPCHPCACPCRPCSPCGPCRPGRLCDIWRGRPGRQHVQLSGSPWLHLDVHPTNGHTDKGSLEHQWPQLRGDILKHHRPAAQTYIQYAQKCNVNKSVIKKFRKCNMARSGVVWPTADRSKADGRPKSLRGRPAAGGPTEGKTQLGRSKSCELLSISGASSVLVSFCPSCRLLQKKQANDLLQSIL